MRAASVSGAVTDLPENFAEAAQTADTDFIVGDWISKYNITIRGSSKADNSDNKDADAAYEHTFIDALKPALLDIAKRGIKVAMNTGSSDTKRLHEVIEETPQLQNIDLTIAWVERDEVFEIFKKQNSPYQFSEYHIRPITERVEL